MWVAGATWKPKALFSKPHAGLTIRALKPTMDGMSETTNTTELQTAGLVRHDKYAAARALLPPLVDDSLEILPLPEITDEEAFEAIANTKFKGDLDVKKFKALEKFGKWMGVRLTRQTVDVNVYEMALLVQSNMRRLTERIEEAAKDPTTITSDPENPTVVVDSTADLANSAASTARAYVELMKILRPHLREDPTVVKPEDGVRLNGKNLPPPAPGEGKLTIYSQNTAIIQERDSAISGNADRLNP
jgi:hypothetical protein